MVSSGSPVTTVVRLSISWVNSMAWAFHAPKVSMTNGTKMWVDKRLAYLADLAAAAWSVAAPPVIEVQLRTMISHANCLTLVKDVYPSLRHYYYFYVVITAAAVKTNGGVFSMSRAVGWIMSSPVSGMAVNTSCSQQDGRVVDAATPWLLGWDLSAELRQCSSP